ncbi:MAG TPA: hypothetical protein VK982_15175, partial [Bacteroidales bacterium]|nr:hypothetical protein [Bacteroidales bacterium]
MSFNTSSNIGMEDYRAIAAVVVLGVIGALGTFSFLPYVVGQAVNNFSINEQQAGFLATAEMGGNGLATFLISIFIFQVNRKKMAFSGLLLI